MYRTKSSYDNAVKSALPTVTQTQMLSEGALCFYYNEAINSKMTPKFLSVLSLDELKETFSYAPGLLKIYI